METLKTKASRIRLPFFLLIFKKRKEKKEKRKDHASAISPFSFLVSYFKRVLHNSAFTEFKLPLPSSAE